MPRSEARSRASDALWLVGLGEERFRALGTMSTGQRQRVKLAQAIAADPSLILLDEPTDGLDPVQRDEMLALIKQISGEYRIDVMLSSHLLEEVERVSDQLAAVTSPYCILCVPLLVEKGGYENVNRVLVVDCPTEIQVTRVLERDQLTRKQVDAIMQTQASRRDRLRLADDVIENSAGLEV